MVQPRSHDVEERLLRSCARVTRWASRHARFEAPLAQVRVLSLVEDLEPVRIGDLASVDQSSQPAMSALVTRVEGLGWVAREEDPEDSRACLVTLTDRGRAALASARSARADALRTALEGLDEAALQRLEDAVDVIENVVARTSSSPVPA